MIRLALRVQSERAELVLAELLELAGGGVEELELADGRVEYAIYGAEGELPALPDLEATAKGALCEISTSTIRNDWHERWRAFHRPTLIRGEGAGLGRGRSLYIRPPWMERGEGEGVDEIVIDPGQAFGTGSHATTKLSLKMLLDLHQQITALEGERAAQRRVLDFGTGSGILAIAAAKLRFHPVIGLDFDRESIAAASLNAARNCVSLELREADLLTEPLPPLDGAIVLANLLRPTLSAIASRMTTPPRELLLSGVLVEEADEVSSAFSGHLPLLERARSVEGEWAGIWLTMC